MKRNIYELIEKAKNEKAEEILNYNEKILALSEKEKKIKEDLAAALKDNNAEQYAKAKADQRATEDKIEFYQLKLNEAETTGIITDPEEVKKLAEEIRVGVNESTAEKINEAAGLLREAEKIVNEARKEIIKGNQALTSITDKTNVAPRHIELIMLNGLVNIIKNALENGSFKRNKTRS